MGVKDKVIEKLIPKFEEHGFKWVKSKSSFTRKTKIGLTYEIFMNAYTGNRKGFAAMSAYFSLLFNDLKTMSEAWGISPVVNKKLRPDNDDFYDRDKTYITHDFYSEDSEDIFNQKVDQLFIELEKGIHWLEWVSEPKNAVAYEKEQEITPNWHVRGMVLIMTYFWFGIEAAENCRKEILEKLKSRISEEEWRQTEEQIIESCKEYNLPSRPYSIVKYRIPNLELPLASSHYRYFLAQSNDLMRLFKTWRKTQ